METEPTVCQKSGLISQVSVMCIISEATDCRNTSITVCHSSRWRLKISHVNAECGLFWQSTSLRQQDPELLRCFGGTRFLKFTESCTYSHDESVFPVCFHCRNKTKADVFSHLNDSCATKPAKVIGGSSYSSELWYSGHFWVVFSIIEVRCPLSIITIESTKSAHTENEVLRKHKLFNFLTAALAELLVYINTSLSDAGVTRAIVNGL